jgi:hypothetical protein
MKFPVKQVIKRYDKLKADRHNWEDHWQEIADRFIPNKNEIVIKREHGTKRNTNLFDSTGPHALELLSAALHTMLTNPNAVWAEFFTGDEDIDNQDDVRKWLQKAARKFSQLLSQTNFHQAIHEVYLDIGSIGTAIMSQERDPERKVRYRTVAIREAVFEWG